MDLPIPVGQPPDTVEEQALPAVEPTPAGAVDPEPTLAEVREELATLSRRVEGLATSFEGAVRLAVAEEVRKVAGELQHTVAALGRILVRDLGKLNQILAEHRDTVVAEVHKATSGGQSATGPVPSSGRAASAATSAPSGGETGADGGDPGATGSQAAAGSGDVPASGGDTAADEGSASRHWRRRKA